jgi:hypothetical protein
MMEGVKDDFYVEDEHVEDVQRAWDAGKPVLVIPSRLRHQVRSAARRAVALLDDLRRTAARVIEPPPSRRLSSPERGSRASSGRRAEPGRGHH